ncbi:hypothetical protein [Blastococcus deserti]|uniref:Ankyrin repeat protein n=1 Tax=Blastococcus deserti TaxID=2259033 RepID=A0ABW4XH33_9ACTN
MTGEPIDPGSGHGRVDDRGRTALAAAFRQSTDTVARLLGAGADPDAGGPGAPEPAGFFDVPAMVELLDAR